MKPEIDNPRLHVKCTFVILAVSQKKKIFKEEVSDQM